MNPEETTSRLAILKDLLKAIEASALLDQDTRERLGQTIARTIERTIDTYT